MKANHATDAYLLNTQTASKKSTCLTVIIRDRFQKRYDIQNVESSNLTAHKAYSKEKKNVT